MLHFLNTLFWGNFFSFQSYFWYLQIFDFLDSMYTAKQKRDFLKRENDWHYFRNLIAEIWIVQITIKMQNIMFNVRVTDYLFPQVYTIEYIMEFNQYKQAKSSPKYKWLRYDILK